MYSIMPHHILINENVKRRVIYPRYRTYVFPARYDHHEHTSIKEYSYARNRPLGPIGVYPVRYEHHLHIKEKSYPRKRQ
jgi:hypothetical protein